MVEMVRNVFFSHCKAQGNWEKNTSFLPGFKMRKGVGKGFVHHQPAEYSVCISFVGQAGNIQWLLQALEWGGSLTASNA